jgi:hypothetical protein
MHLAHLRLRDFRNYGRLDVDFAPGFHLLLGNNAQGKTNILEAIYLIATLRSFRGVGSGQMVRHGQKGYFVGSRVVSQGEHETKMYWSTRERSLSLDSRPVRKLTEYAPKTSCLSKVPGVPGAGSWTCSCRKPRLCIFLYYSGTPRRSAHATPCLSKRRLTQWLLTASRMN